MRSASEWETRRSEKKTEWKASHHVEPCRLSRHFHNKPNCHGDGSWSTLNNLFHLSSLLFSSAAVAILLLLMWKRPCLLPRLCCTVVIDAPRWLLRKTQKKTKSWNMKKRETRDTTRKASTPSRSFILFTKCDQNESEMRTIAWAQQTTTVACYMTLWTTVENTTCPIAGIAPGKQQRSEARMNNGEKRVYILQKCKRGRETTKKEQHKIKVLTPKKIFNNSLMLGVWMLN